MGGGLPGMKVSCPVCKGLVDDLSCPRLREWKEGHESLEGVRSGREIGSVAGSGETIAHVREVFPMVTIGKRRPLE